MNAKSLAEEYQNALVGRIVITARVGAWPGGAAVVTEMLPDENAPEIVFQVFHPIHGSMGVFAHEDITLTDQAEDADSSDVLLRVLDWMTGEHLKWESAAAKKPDIRKLAIRLSDALDHVEGCRACSEDDWRNCDSGGKEAYKAKMEAREVL